MPQGGRRNPSARASSNQNPSGEWRLKAPPPAMRHSRVSTESASVSSRKRAPRLDDPGRYFSGSGVAFTVSQFLSARLMFAAEFFRHSVAQYLVWLTYSLPFTIVKASGSTVSL
jgi:hypothetical protein